MATPNFGNMAPIAIGFSIFIAVGSMGAISGGAFNPARYFGPALVYGCTIDKIWDYFLAEYFAAAMVGVVWRFMVKPWQTRRLKREQQR